MNQIVTTGIVLTRREFGEADRLITVITPDHGKVPLIAKGVRRPKSKLASGIELFSVSHITYLKGRGAFSTLVSSRLIMHYGAIVKNLERTMLGYDLLKILNKATEDAAGGEYFELLRQTFIGLDNPGLDRRIVELWFYMQLLKLAGHTPNLRKDAAGHPLDPAATYLFDYDSVAFARVNNEKQTAPYAPHHIKLLRLGFSVSPPAILSQVENVDTLLDPALHLIKTILKDHIRI
jgi:DNA repair protein RecO